ncbi:hypothetical protein RRG08_004909 [Elysia crispata]|uniref:Uncharacterized protein n=1 Tax=Elysia crispata TaxID=231223 RepID=A0AAE0ZHW4_9GAST|nr:hypothetical protein RRG08_004909 [Elysia crispata]
MLAYVGAIHVPIAVPYVGHRSVERGRSSITQRLLSPSRNVELTNPGYVPTLARVDNRAGQVTGFRPFYLRPLVSAQRRFEFSSSSQGHSSA